MIGPGVNYIRNNSATCLPGALLIWPWNERGEGSSGLCPSLGDP